MIVKQMQAKTPRILLLTRFFFFVVFWQQRSFRRAKCMTPSKMTSMTRKRTRHRCLAVCMSNTFCACYRKHVSMTIHQANVSENIALFSQALLKSCSEKRARDRNMFESQLDAVKTAALTRMGDQDNFVVSIKLSIFIILFNFIY